MDLDQLLDELEDVVERGERFWHVFGGRAMVRADEVYDLIHRVRASIPEDVRQVQDGGRERERLIEEAHQERAKIIEAAKEQARLLLDNDQLVIEAQRKRDDILERARIEAEGIQADAEQYAESIIDKLSEYLGRVQTAVGNTREMLQRDAEATRPQPGSEDTAT
jgi:vacuolar-type H+-ATPase subunit H